MSGCFFTIIFLIALLNFLIALKYTLVHKTILRERFFSSISTGGLFATDAVQISSYQIFHSLLFLKLSHGKISILIRLDLVLECHGKVALVTLP